MAKLIIISTVGTSIYTNFHSRGFLNDIWLNLSDNNKSASEYDTGEVDYSEAESEIKDNFFKGYVKESNEFKPKKGEINYDCCAEVKTIKKIYDLKKPKNSVEIELHLLHSDTANGKSSAILVKSFFEIYNLHNNQTIHIHLIEKLNTLNKQSYREGVNNLIVQIHNTPYRSLDEFIINISGGFKGFIPYLTIYSQLFEKTMCYIYEDSSELVEISPLHLTFDFNSLINIYPYLCEGKISTYNKVFESNKTFSNFFFNDNEAELQVNPLGKIAQFSMEKSLFRESDDAINYLLKQLSKENEKEKYTELPIVLEDNTQYDMQPLSFLYLISKDNKKLNDFEGRYKKEHSLVLYIWYPKGIEEKIAKAQKTEVEEFMKNIGYKEFTIKLVQDTIKY